MSYQRQAARESCQTEAGASPARICVRFVGGTLEISGLANKKPFPPGCRWDPRAGCFRAPASAYSPILETLSHHGDRLIDSAYDGADLATPLCVKRPPRPFQTEALQAWQANGGRGVVALPTGAGKSYLALLAIDHTRRHTLVVAPTLDLVTQWYDLLRSSFRCPVGVIGGGEYDPQPLTVTTYDSASIHMNNLGNRFGMVVFDECHHLPSDTYALAAQCCLAPFRLGLSATFERADGRHALLQQLVGPLAYRCDIDALAGRYLAPFVIEQIFVSLSDEEQRRYDEARAVYLTFLAQQGIRMSTRDGFSQFVMRSSLSATGRRAMRAYQLQRELAFSAPSKLHHVAHLLRKHKTDRTLLFTETNNTALALSRHFLLPVITHQTHVRERSAILHDFAHGTYNALVSSKVLNEGVDIPEANIGIVISGSGSKLEYKQRLGRILRKMDDKRAVLYELVTRNTSEMNTSTRRRDPHAHG